MKLIKAKRQADKTFLHFIRATKKAATNYAKDTEVVSVTHNTATDGLRHFDYEFGDYVVDHQNRGVPTLNDTITSK